MGMVTIRKAEMTLTPLTVACVFRSS